MATVRSGEDFSTVRGAALRAATPASAPRHRRLRSSGPERRAQMLGLTPESRQLEPVPETPDGRDGLALRAVLVALDATVLALAWLVAVFVPAWVGGGSGNELAGLLAAVTGAVACSLALIAAQGLYRARVSSVRSVEIARLGRVVLLTGIALLVVAGWTGLDLSVGAAALGSAVAFLLLATSRGFYSGWLRRSRAQGRFCRRVVVVGTGDESYELYRLLELHPEVGYRVVGVAGPRSPLSSWPTVVPWVGDLAQVSGAVAKAGANGVIVAASDLGSEELNSLTRELVREGIHVHLSSGLRGIDHRRLRSLPLAHEPFFYLEPASLSRGQLLCKRAVDLLVAGVGGLLTAPVVLIGAIAVKLGDGGPVLFRQTRIGRDGNPFTLLKLRTMVPDAEAQLVDLTGLNQREGGPLFKVEADPRRTRVGRVLERTSLDELPQLWNVLRGDMSLVGPRPALPHEVEEFDDALLDRHRVLPGITGLWQVEGRDKPEFDVYRRLDLFYVENWTVGLDLAILLGTVGTVFCRLARSLCRRSEPTAADLELSTP